jgi:hypothetical protein
MHEEESAANLDCCLESGVPGVLTTSTGLLMPRSTQGIIVYIYGETSTCRQQRYLVGQRGQRLGSCFEHTVRSVSEYIDYYVGKARLGDYHFYSICLTYNELAVCLTPPGRASLCIAIIPPGRDGLHPTLKQMVYSYYGCSRP